MCFPASMSKYSRKKNAVFFLEKKKHSNFETDQYNVPDVNSAEHFFLDSSNLMLFLLVVQVNFLKTMCLSHSFGD